MDRAEKAHVKEIERVKLAIEKTKSKYLIADYNKYLSTLEKELSEYRRYKYGKTKN